VGGIMNITFNNVGFKYYNPLLENINFTIKDDSKIGLLGKNGTGKSTLLKLLLGEENPQSGEIIKTSNIKISYLGQETSFNLNDNINKILKNITEEKSYQFKSLLGKFNIYDYEKTFEFFSKGELKRIEIAYVFTQDFDLLILDEITNHLDFDIIIWIESYLKKLTKALFLITHDRYFLQNVCTEIFEIERNTLFRYEGNYEKYLELKELNQQIFNKEQEKLKKKFKTELEWIRKGVEARRTKSKERIQKFNELQNKIINQSNDNISLEFKTERLGKDILIINRLGKQINDRWLFKDFSYIVLKNDRIGIVGKNGTGKSTLFKILVGLEEKTTGDFTVGETVKFGYFSQAFDEVNEDMSVIDYIKSVSEVIYYDGKELSAASFLEMFLFPYRDHQKKIKALSGGERRRLQLIRTLINNPNVLLLDEPTNDLDIQTLEVLEEYLENFNGVLITVSHDRYFLEKTTDKIFYLNNQEFNIQYRSIFDIVLDEEKTKKVNKVTYEKTKKLKMTYQEKKEYETILDDIDILEQEIASLDQEILNNSTSYSTVMKLTEEKQEKEELLNNKLDRYVYLESLMERIKNGE
jgi:ATP-binding cassette subfamily F protein uup